MRTSVFVFIVFVQILLRGTIAGAAQGSKEPAIVIEKKLLLPDRLLAIIESEFPDFMILEESDYPESVLDFEYIFHNYADTTLPYVCWGDFNGDERTDVALILIAKAYRSPDYKPRDEDAIFVVFHRTEDGYEPQVLLDGKPRMIWVDKLLITMPPQEIITAKGKGYASDPNDPDSIHPQFDSILFQKSGSAASVFYWEDGRYNRIWVSD